MLGARWDVAFGILAITGGGAQGGMLAVREARPITFGWDKNAVEDWRVGWRARATWVSR